MKSSFFTPLTVEPKAARGYNMSLFQLFGKGPRWTITCGACEASFSARLPMIDNPGVACPACGAVNVLPLIRNGGVE